MKLSEQLDAIRAGSAKMIPPEKLSVMTQATRALRESGILKSMVQAGATLPPFALANVHGQTVSSAAAMGRRGMVLTVFRGHW
ncbi:MAG: hypothetical protein RL434_334 [Pseudomonadota bacterium]|jgi:hypothetical protein